MSKLFGPGGNPVTGGPPQMHVNMQELLENGTPILCSCGSKTFMPIFTAVSVSRIALSAPEDVIATQQFIVCTQCSKNLEDVIQEFKSSKEGAVNTPSSLVS